MVDQTHAMEGGRLQRRVLLDVDGDGRIVALIDQEGSIKLAKPLVPGTRLFDLLHPDDSDKYLHNRDWCAAHPGQDIALKLRFSRGLDWWLPLMVTLAIGPNGRLEVLLELDDALKARMDATQMRQLVEGSQQGIVVRNREKILYINNGYARMLGYGSAAELVTAEHIQDTDDGIHPDDRQMVIERIKARLEGREAVSHYELRVKRRDESYIWVETLASLVQWDGEPASLSWLIDISARKRAEEQLIQSRETAERANRAKSNFLASMSHELRTPLNAIIGFSEIMRAELHGPLAEKYMEYAGDVHRSGRHLLELINDVLDMSKLEAGKHTIKESDVSVAALLAEGIALVRHGVKEQGLVLIEKVQDNLPLVRADERALRQILLNFLSNAIKFTPQGGSITVGANLVRGEGLRFFVSDTGIGMSKDEIKLAMEPFGQVDSSIAHKSKGTGLGLPISFGLMRLHGGDVAIESTPGEGTTMIARLPLSRVIDAAA